MTAEMPCRYGCGFAGPAAMVVPHYLRRHPDGDTGHAGIHGFEGYSITRTGEVWSWWKSNGRNARILMPAPYRRLSPGIAGSNGYEQVWLYRGGQRHGRFVHLLVLETFTGPCPSGLQARHLDGNERNNDLSNLAWGTHDENMADRDAHGTTARGETIASARADEALVRRIRSEVAAGATRTAVAQSVGLSISTVGRIVARKTWRHV